MKKNALILVLVMASGVALFGQNLILMTPRGGEHWLIGTNQMISWNVDRRISGILYINLWGYNNTNQLIHLGTIAETDYKTGFYSWKAGDLNGRRMGIGRYFIYIRIWLSQDKVLDAKNAMPFFLDAFSYRH